jgi:hypothetical protein
MLDCMPFCSYIVPIMENMGTSARTVGAPPPLVVEISAMTRQRLDELDRLRGIGMARAMELDGADKGLSPEQHFRLQVRNAGAFDRIGRAVRQIMTLEFELLGLFEAPDRDAFPKPRKIKPQLAGILTKPRSDIGRIKPIDLKDLRLRPDYRNGPMEDVVAGIRKTLGAEPPPNDPFAPPPDRKVREPAPIRKASAPKLPPATVKLPEKPQVNRAFEAAMLALSAKLGDGFRIPADKPKYRPNPARPPKRRRNRGPPK